MPAQHFFRFNVPADVVIPTVSVGFNLTGYFLNKKATALTETDIAQLDPESIWKLDRGATQNWSKPIATVSDITMIAGMIMPVFVFADKERVVRREWSHFLMYGEAFLLNAGLTAFTKVVSKRTRPYVYNPDSPLEKKMEKDAKHSFFSGHTSFSATGAFYYATAYTIMNRGDKAIPAVWAISASVPLTTAILRVLAGKHYITDVLVGFVVGATVGSVVPLIHRK